MQVQKSSGKRADRRGKKLSITTGKSAITKKTKISKKTYEGGSKGTNSTGPRKK